MAGLVLSHNFLRTHDLEVENELPDTLAKSGCTPSSTRYCVSQVTSADSSLLKNHSSTLARSHSLILLFSMCTIAPPMSICESPPFPCKEPTSGVVGRATRVPSQHYRTLQSRVEVSTGTEQPASGRILTPLGWRSCSTDLGPHHGRLKVSTDTEQPTVYNCCQIVTCSLSQSSHVWISTGSAFPVRIALPAIQGRVLVFVPILGMSTRLGGQVRRRSLGN